MAKRQFKTESKRILDLMVNSIYTHREIFLRELISNASDALDKLWYLSLTHDDVQVEREELKIKIDVDKDARTLTITDNGIGMTKDELAENLGTIAKSGAQAFREQHAGEEVDIIGQFGVGFYSAFMVSSHIDVESRAYGEGEAYCWSSDGADGYTLTPCEKESCGTVITLYLREDTEDEKYSEYLEQYRLSSLIKKYSDYIRYPIVMDMKKSRLKEGNEDEYEEYTEAETLNSMIPIWRRNKDEVTEEEYNNFYRDKFYDFSEPTKVINTRVEGSVTYTALLFIPSKLPYDYYTKNFEKGLQLYCNGVMIMEKCADLLPDHFGFVRGIVDSSDFSLNISREVLQHDRQLKLIAKNLEKKIREELEKLLKDDREKYEKFYDSFGLQLKYGVYQDYGMHKEKLQDLLLYHSLTGEKKITLKEYVADMDEEQKNIYYACAKTVEQAAALPQIDALRDKGYDVLCMTDDVDEFAVKMLHDYDGKEFRSVSDSDLGIETDEEKQSMKDKAEANKELLEKLSKALDGKVKEVRLSARLKKHPVCLVSGSELSIEMEKVLNAMPTENKVNAEKVLEINAEHPVFAALEGCTDEEKISKYARLLYDQALLIAGMPIEDPVAFTNSVCEIMAKA